jgi:acetolactate synthase-1/2/3 large subunit
VGDAKQILSELAEQSTPGETEEWVEYLTKLKNAVKPEPLLRPGFIEPRAFITALSDQMQEDAVLVADVGLNQIWSANRYEVRRGRFLTSGGMGTMGYSIPAALGAACAQKGRQIVVVVGDGAFQMSMMELATIMQYGLDVKIVIMRNDRLGMVCELQTKLYRCRYVATTLGGSPDFIALGQAYGIAGAKLCDNAHAKDAIASMLAHKGPYLLECLVSPEEGSM